ncbi:MAG TPA: bifunctional precorrin-2 dehydrogenase/sirohydrochlorin ferrochelatase [Gemmatimonadaceae bacterium]|nr:bifunctional precorrin-2 dehydrogenase/sirohydrochlorin ferrochelatase [Gemmatimonadaceae bacterium]
MTLVPVGIEAARITALVVGGGALGTRKALALADAGARVRVISPVISDQLKTAGASHLSLIEREYAGIADIDDAVLVIAATGRADIDARVADDANATHRLVNVVSDAQACTFTSMAVHRAGDVTIGVSAGGVPAAARQIRDRICANIDERYALAIATCADARADALRHGGTDTWAALQPRLIGADFCERVEGRTFGETLEACR